MRETRLPVRASIRCATARLSALFSTPIAKRAAEAEPGAANASTKVASTSRLMPVPPSASGSRPRRIPVPARVGPGSRPGTSSSVPSKLPLSSIVARATVRQLLPLKRCSATLAPGKTGRAYPRSLPASGMPWKRTSGATETWAIVLLTGPLVSR